MKILALDASTKSTGWAVFEDAKLQNYGCLTASSTDLIKRINKMIEGLKVIILSQENIDKIILEEVRPEETGIQNLKTHKALMYLQAAIVFLIHDNFKSIEIEYVYPSEWRAKCGIKTGRGIQRTSLKTKDIDFVKDTYDIVVNDDIADAIGIGHAFVNNLENEINWE